jgi:hypothetical protein
MIGDDRIVQAAEPNGGTRIFAKTANDDVYAMNKDGDEKWYKIADENPGKDSSNKDLPKLSFCNTKLTETASALDVDVPVQDDDKQNVTYDLKKEEKDNDGRYVHVFDNLPKRQGVTYTVKELKVDDVDVASADFPYVVSPNAEKGTYRVTVSDSETKDVDLYKTGNTQPQVEKYVNNKVHDNIVNFDKDFTYSVMAYVPKGATEVTITDTLKDDLEFIYKDAEKKTVITAIEFFSGNDSKGDGQGTVATGKVDGNNVKLNRGVDGLLNKTRQSDKPENERDYAYTVEGNTLTFTLRDGFLNTAEDALFKKQAAGLDGVWVKVSFKAQIKEGSYDKIVEKINKINNNEANADATDDGISWVKVTDDNSTIKDGKSYSKVTDGKDVEKDKSHAGLANKAGYAITIGNQGSSSYETNTVTVKPDLVEYKAKKKWLDENGGEMTWPRGASVTFSLWKVPANGEAVCVETAQPITSDQTVTFSNQPKLEKANYEVRESVSGVRSYQVGSPTVSDNTYTFTNRITENDIIPAKFKIKASKTLTENGKEKEIKDEATDPYNGKFTFTLTPDENNKVHQTTQNKSNKGGVVEFDEIEYTEAGTYKYTITEDLPDGVTTQNPVKDGIKYDTSEKIVIVDVAKNDGIVSITKVTVDDKEVTPDETVGEAVSPGDTIVANKGSYDAANVDYYYGDGSPYYQPLPNIDSIYVGSQEAFCLDDEFVTPDGKTYNVFNATDASDLNDTETIRKIKKLLYFGMPFDSGTGEIVQKIIREGSIQGVYTYDYNSARDLLRMTTQMLLQDITNEKQGRTGRNFLGEYINPNNGNYLHSYPGSMEKTASWIWKKVIDPNTNDAVNKIEIYTYHPDGWNTVNRPTNEDSKTYLQRIIIPK